VRGDSRQFKLSLLTRDGFDILSYQARFATAGSLWEPIRLPLADFRAGYRGREVSNAPALEPASIRQVGLMIAARQAGLFELHIRRISLA
jgi:NADH dehydrogenase [ubiquinone] 1 alpha subcomplex assembly factor 1